MQARILLLLALAACSSCLRAVAGNPPLPPDDKSGASTASVTVTRLNGGTSYLNGRVEVQLGGKWGAICAKGFGQAEAAVVCRELGLRGGTASKVALGSQVALVSKVNCLGSESRLAFCQFSSSQACGGWAAAVTCQNPVILAVRLEDTDDSNAADAVVIYGPPTSPSPSRPTWGTVQVLLSGSRWGAVCSKGFTEKEAAVVCRMIGKVGGVVMKEPAQSTAPTVLYGLRCNGYEANLTACAYSTGMGICDSSDAVGVECQDPAPLPARLVGGPNGNEGRVEVAMGGKWGTICSPLFNDAAARVLCRSMGLEAGRVVRNAAKAYGRGKGAIHLTNTRCNGNEPSLSACQFSTSTGQCTHAQDVGVMCRKPFVGVSILGGAASGYLGAYFFGPPMWESRSGTICRDGFGDKEAKVACRTAGFVDGKLVSRVADPIDIRASQKVINNVKCKGTERDLYFCMYDTAECKTGRAVEVRCTAARIEGIRLVGGGLKGLLQVKVKGRWGAVCDSGFGKQEANVTCRHLGHSGGVVDPPEDSGGKFQTAIISDVNCKGTEASLNECEYDASGEPDSFEDLGCFEAQMGGIYYSAGPVGLKCTA